MDAKHQFKYTYNETDLEEYSPHEITFEMPGEATLDQMLNNFQSYLKAVGFIFDGTLQIVDDTFNIMDELDGTLYEFDEEEPKGGCMADFDKEYGSLGDSITPKEYQEQRLKEWNKGIAKLDQEVKEQREIKGKSSLRTDELKEMNERWYKLSYDQKMKIYEKSLKESDSDSDSDNCWNS